MDINTLEDTNAEVEIPVNEPIYKSKDGQIITHSQLLNSGYKVNDINSGITDKTLSVIGDTKDEDQEFQSKDGQRVNTKTLLGSGYSQKDIDGGILDGILTPIEKKNQVPITTVPLETPQDFSDGSQVGASNGTTPTTEPAIVPPPAEPTNPIDILLDAKSNINKTIRSSSTDAMGNISEVDLPDEEANKKGKASLDKLKAQKIDTEDLYNQIKDLPKEVYDIKVQKADGTIDTPYSKERLSQEYIDSPVSFSYKMDAIKNRLTLKKAASELTAAGTPTDGAALSEYYNRLGDAVPTMQQWEDNQQKRVDLINQYLVGEEKTIALQRAKNSASSFYNPDNTAIITEYDASPLKSKIDISQFAALQSMKVFQPDQYKQALSLINFDPKVQTEDKDGISFVQQSPNLSALNKSETVESINIRKGKEKILKDLSEAGRNNAISVIQYQNELIAKNLKQVPPDQSSDLVNQYNTGTTELKKITDRNAELKTQIEETLGKYKNPLIEEYNNNIAKANSISQGINAIAEQIKQIPDSPAAGLIQRYNDNIAKIKDIQNDAKNDDAKYPLLADQKYDQLVKDFMGQSGYSALVGGLGAVGTDMYKTGRTLVESTLAGSLTAGYLGKISSSLAGYNPLGDVARQARAKGETLTTEADFYRPPNQQAEEPLFVNKFDKPLADQLNAVIKGRDLKDLSAAEKGVLKNIIKDNSAQVHTITNPKFGKSKNFLSISTVYDNVHAIGTIVSFAIQAGLLKGAGMGSAMASAIPLFTTSKQDFYKEAVEKGMPNPDEYANVHASIMFLAGFVSPRLDVLKKIVGIESEAGVLLNGISDKTWNSVINKNQGLLNRITNSASNVASTTAHMVGVFGAGTSIAGNLANIGIYSEQKGIGQVLDEAYESSKHMVSDMAALTALGAITNFKSTSTEQKARLWELGNNKKNNIIAIEEDLANHKISAQEAEDRKKIVNEVQDIISKMPTKNAKGGLMTDGERLNYFYNLLTQKKIKTEEAVLPEAQKEKLNYVSMVTDHLNNLIIDPKDPKELEKRKIELQKILTPKPDKEGKLIELKPEVELNTLAELEAINKHLEDKEAELAPTLTPEEILSGKKAEKTPTEIGGYKVVGEETPVGGERVFKVVDENGTERFLTADGKELLVAKATAKMPTETTTAEVVQETKLPTEELPQETEVTAPTLEEGTVVELPAQIKGGTPRQMVYKDGEWQQQVGSQITGVSEKVQQQAQAEFDSKTPKVQSAEKVVTPPPIGAVKPEFHNQVDEKAEALKKLLINPNLRGAKKSGIGAEELIDYAATIIKKAYDAGTSIKEAVELAVSHIKNNWDNKWGKLNEQEVRDNLNKLNAELPQQKGVGVGEVASALKDVHNNNSELSKIGTEQEYSTYVEKIFPNSKIKVPIYRAFGNDQYKTINKAAVEPNGGIYVTADKNYVESFAKAYKVPVSNVLVDVKNVKNIFLDHKESKRQNENILNGKKLEIEKLTKEDIDKLKEMGYDAVNLVSEPFGDIPQKENQELVLFDKKQLHILGGKEDIEGFKKYKSESLLSKEQAELPQPKGVEKGNFVKDKNGNYYPTKADLPKGFTILETADSDPGYGRLFDNFGYGIMEGSIEDIAKELRDSYPIGTSAIKDGTNLDLYSNIDKFTLNQLGHILQHLDTLGDWDTMAKDVDAEPNEFQAKELETELLAESRDKLREYVTDMLKSDKSDEYIGFDIPKDGLGKTELPQPITEPKTDAERKTVADQLRQLKSKKGKAYDAVLGIPVAIWDGTVELVAKSIEGGTAIAEAIKRGINYIEKNHRGKWDKQGFNEKLIESLGYKGIRLNGEDVIAKPMTDKKSAEVINGFYSPLEQGVLDAKGEKFTGKEWAKKLEGTTEGDEMKFTGMSDFLSQNADKSLTKQEVLDYMKNNRIEISEIVKSEENAELSESERNDLYSNIEDSLYNTENQEEEVIDFVSEKLNKWKDNPTKENFRILSNALGEVNLNIYEFIDDIKTETGAGTKYENYQLPGKKTNYKEVLVTLPFRGKIDARKELGGNPEIITDSKKSEEINGEELENGEEMYYYPSGLYIKKLANGKFWTLILNEDKSFDTLPQAELWLSNNADKVTDVITHENRFQSSHFDEPNILAHIRMSTRVDAEGNKILHLEEFQSDWGQQGKKHGFAITEKDRTKGWKIEEATDKSGYYIFNPKGEKVSFEFNKEDAEVELNELANTSNETGEKIGTIPSAPFVTETANWTKLAWKVALKEAVKEGADKITWTTGEQQNERYDLSKTVDEISYLETKEKGIYDVKATKNKNEIFADSKMDLKKIEATFGKDIAEKISNSEGEVKRGITFISGENLKAGGSGMKGFYGSPKEGKLGIVGEVIKSMTGQEPQTTILNKGVTESLKAYEYDGTQDVSDVPGSNYIKKGEWVVESPTGLKMIVEASSKETAIQEFKDAASDADVNILSGNESVQHSIDITPEIKEGVKAGMSLFKSPFHSRVDRIASAVKGFLINPHLEGVKKSGMGAEELIDFAANIIKKAYDAGSDIKVAIDAAIKHLKDNWDSAWGNFNEGAVKNYFEDLAEIPAGMSQEEWTGIRQAKLKEIDSIRQLFEKEVGTTWSIIQQSALEDIQKRFPKKTLADAIATRVQELAMKYDVEGQDSYNPTAKDLAVIQEYIRQTNRKLRDVKEDLSSDNDIERQVAILNIEGLNNDLLNAGKASFKREAGTAFGFRASESRLDINNGLEIRRAQLMRANDGEKLSATDEQWVKDQWEKEKALIIKEQEIREQGLKDEFDRKIAQLQKEFDDKLKSTKPKVPLTERKKTLSQKGKDIADQIRKFKLTGTKSDFTLGSWNSAIEGIALLCEKGATILEAIDDLIKSKQLGFKTNEDRAKFEDNLANHLNNLGKRDTSLEKIKAMAAQSGSNTITNEMVVAGAIKDYVNSHIGEFDKSEILDKSLEGLKTIFPDLDKNTLRRAFLKLDEFKQDSKRDIEKRLAQESRELKRLILKESKQEATETEAQQRKLEEEKQSTLRKIKEFRRKLKEEEFEKEPPVVLKKQDAALIQLNKEKYAAESEFRKKQTQLQEKNKHWAERLADTIRSTMIAKLIGSPVTLAKVAYMSFIRPTGETIRKGGMGLIFDAFFPGISKAAERGGESSSLTALAKGWQAYFINVGQTKIESIFKKASENYDQAAKAYYNALDAGADAKTLKKLEKNMNQALVKASGNIVYQFIGSTSLNDAWQSFIHRSNEIEKQFGKVDIESFKDGNAIDKLNYVIGFIGRSHSAAKTFSGRFSYTVSFMTRLQAAARDGSLSDPNRIIEIAHESYIDWERGKYQQANWVTETWNNIISGITRKNAEHPSWDTYNKALAAGVKSEVAITRVPVNILHEALVEMTLGAFKAPLLAFKEYSKAKKQAVTEGYSKTLDSVEFKARVKEIIQSMDQAQAARIFRLFTKGSLGLGLYGLTAMYGLMHFGVFQHKGQKKKKEEDLLEEDELNPGQVMLGKTKMGETASKLIEHTPSLWPTFMGLGLAKIYSDDVKSGKMTSQAAWDAFYTHLQIIEGSIPQAKVLGPLEVSKNIGKQLGGVASTFGMFDTYIDGKGNWINREKEALVITSPEVLKLKEYKVAPPELGVRKMYKLQVDGTHPKVGANKDGVAYALMNDFEWQKFNDYRKEYINTSLAELYRAADTDLPKIGGGTVKEIILNKENLTDALSTIVRQASVIAKSKMIDEKLLPEKNEDKEEDLNVQDIKDIINDFYEDKQP